MRSSLQMEKLVLLFLLVVSCVMLLEIRLGSIITQSWKASDGATDAALVSYSALHEVVNISALDLRRGEVHILKPHGIASHFFIELSSYRTGARHFTTVGLIAQHLEELHERDFSCEWLSQRENSTTVKGKVWKIRPDFSYHRLYGTLVISCTFDKDIDDLGGSLWISASYGDAFRPDEKFIVLTEAPGDFNTSAFKPPFPYEYVYCGSPLFGNLSPQRVREWIAYHSHLFGERAHFILYDGGGIHDEVYKILAPWVKLGKVSIQNVREANVYDGYLHHQFATVNDCMLRAQTLANWTFFFDLDEYLFLNESAQGGMGSLVQVLEASKQANVSQIQLEPSKMHLGACLQDPQGGVGNHTRDAVNAKKWMMEKLVFAWQYRWPILRDKKYAIQSRSCWATGVHKCEHLIDGGQTQVMDEAQFRFYHYRDTVAIRGEVCKEFTTTNYLVIGDDNYYIDDTMVGMVEVVKEYEQQTIGVQPFIL